MIPYDSRISIIIPVYNSQDYLDECLNSIIFQTYKNIEIICVNDSSTDDSLNIINSIADKDDRIKVITVPNAGVSNARNVGLKYSTGEYIMFVDSDDWIDNNTCEIAYKTLAENDADVVMWSYVSEHKNSRQNKKIFDDDFIVFERKDGAFDIHRRLIGIVGKELAHPETKDSLSPVWGKLFKKSIITESGAYFEDLKKIGTYEDGLFNIFAFGKANKAVYVGKCLYHYRRYNATSVTSKYNPDLFSQWHTLYCLIEKYLTDNGLFEIYSEAFYNKIALDILGVGFNAFAPNKKPFEIIRDLRIKLGDSVYHNALKKLKIKNMPIYWKAFFISAKFKLSTVFYLFAVAIKKLK